MHVYICVSTGDEKLIKGIRTDNRIEDHKEYVRISPVSVAITDMFPIGVRS